MNKLLSKPQGSKLTSSATRWPNYMLMVFCLIFLAACGAPASQPPAVNAPTLSPTLHVEVPLNTEPSATSTATPIPTSEPVTSPTPLPTAVPSLKQLTNSGCCVEPFWSPDGSRLLYLDRPSTESPVGYWAVSLEGGTPKLYTERLGVYSNDMVLLAYPQKGETIVERLADGQKWTIPSGGRAVSFSADGSQLAWTGGETGPPFDTARRQVWISQVDGGQARSVFDMYGGGFAGWFPDGRLLVSGRLAGDERFSDLYAVSPQDGRIVLLARGDRLRSVSISPGGSWITYQSLFSSDPAANGLWVVNTSTGTARRLEQFGAHRWQDDGHLLVIPLDMTQPSHQVWQIEAETGKARPLTDPAVTNFKIANGDWSVSPDGRYIAFVSADDNNIWLLSLPNQMGN